MTGAIREFGSKRSEYDVAFVYYAGHGIQVDDENFLLPTKEIFEEEFDVMDYGVSVQNIMRYLRAESNEVNILPITLLSQTGVGRLIGLAKIPPPTGSLIAFSKILDKLHLMEWRKLYIQPMLKKDITVDGGFYKISETNSKKELRLEL